MLLVLSYTLCFVIRIGEVNLLQSILMDFARLLIVSCGVFSVGAYSKWHYALDRLNMEHPMLICSTMLLTLVTLGEFLLGNCY